MPSLRHLNDLRTHPYNIGLHLLLLGLSMLFLALSAAYLYTRVYSGIAPLRIPLLFLGNTVLLLASSYTMMQAVKAYEDDKTQRYKQLLLVTIVLSLAFVALQYLGWLQLNTMNQGLTTGPLNAYVIVLSIVHGIHILGGLPFLILFYITAIRTMNDPITVLVYFTDPYKRLKLNLLTKYWHFLDILWIYLMVFFYLNYWLA
jgi:cytochrome c oxidase subunit III